MESFHALNDMRFFSNITLQPIKNNFQIIFKAVLCYSSTDIFRTRMNFLQKCIDLKYYLCYYNYDNHAKNNPKMLDESKDKMMDKQQQSMKENKDRVKKNKGKKNN